MALWENKTISINSIRPLQHFSCGHALRKTAIGIVAKAFGWVGGQFFGGRAIRCNSQKNRLLGLVRSLGFRLGDFSNYFHSYPSCKSAVREGQQRKQPFFVRHLTQRQSTVCLSPKSPQLPDNERTGAQKRAIAADSPTSHSPVYNLLLLPTV